MARVLTASTVIGAATTRSGGDAEPFFNPSSLTVGGAGAFTTPIRMYSPDGAVDAVFEGVAAGNAQGDQVTTPSDQALLIQALDTETVNITFNTLEGLPVIFDYIGAFPSGGEVNVTFPDESIVYPNNQPPGLAGSTTNANVLRHRAQFRPTTGSFNLRNGILRGRDEDQLFGANHTGGGSLVDWDFTGSFLGMSCNFRNARTLVLNGASFERWQNLNRAVYYGGIDFSRLTLRPISGNLGIPTGVGDSTLGYLLRLNDGLITGDITTFEGCDFNVNQIINPSTNSSNALGDIQFEGAGWSADHNIYLIDHRFRNQGGGSQFFFKAVQNTTPARFYVGKRVNVGFSDDDNVLAENVIAPDVKWRNLGSANTSVVLRPVADRTGATPATPTALQTPIVAGTDVLNPNPGESVVQVGYPLEGFWITDENGTAVATETDPAQPTFSTSQSINVSAREGDIHFRQLLTSYSRDFIVDGTPRHTVVISDAGHADAATSTGTFNFKDTTTGAGINEDVFRLRTAAQQFTNISQADAEAAYNDPALVYTLDNFNQLGGAYRNLVANNPPIRDDTLFFSVNPTTRTLTFEVDYDLTWGNRPLATQGQLLIDSNTTSIQMPALSTILRSAAVTDTIDTINADAQTATTSFEIRHGPLGVGLSKTNGVVTFFTGTIRDASFQTVLANQQDANGNWELIDCGEGNARAQNYTLSLESGTYNIANADIRNLSINRVAGQTDTVFIRLLDNVVDGTGVNALATRLGAGVQLVTSVTFNGVGTNESVYIYDATPVAGAADDALAISTTTVAADYVSGADIATRGRFLGSLTMDGTIGNTSGDTVTQADLGSAITKIVAVYVDDGFTPRADIIDVTSGANITRDVTLTAEDPSVAATIASLNLVPSYDAALGKMVITVNGAVSLNQVQARNGLLNIRDSRGYANILARLNSRTDNTLSIVQPISNASSSSVSLRNEYIIFQPATGALNQSLPGISVLDDLNTYPFSLAQAVTVDGEASTNSVAFAAPSQGIAASTLVAELESLETRLEMSIGEDAQKAQNVAGWMVSSGDGRLLGIRPQAAYDPDTDYTSNT